MTVFGRSLPVATMSCAGQVECKPLLGWNATDWLVVVQMGGQVSAILQRTEQAVVKTALKLPSRHTLVESVAPDWVASRVAGLRS